MYFNSLYAPSHTVPFFSSRPIFMAVYLVGWGYWWRRADVVVFYTDKIDTFFHTSGQMFLCVKPDFMVHISIYRNIAHAHSTRRKCIFGPEAFDYLILLFIHILSVFIIWIQQFGNFCTVAALTINKTSMWINQHVFGLSAFVCVFVPKQDEWCAAYTTTRIQTRTQCCRRWTNIIAYSL